jgi:competence protein ComEC
MHLAIISWVIAFLLRKPLGARAAALAGGLLISAYIYLAGGQPSLVRAGLMYLLGLPALLGNLKARPAVLLALAFLLQLLLQRGSASSLSFILSYLALGGILFGGSRIAELLRGRLPPVLAAGLAASLGAFLATVPVSAYFFGILRPVGILAGLLVMPLSTVFMIGALGNLALGFAAPSLAGPPGRLLSLLAGLQKLTVNLAARVPGLPLSRPLPALGIAALLFFLAWYGAKRRLGWGRALAPFD